MARKKVKLQFIEDYAARKVSYTKRKISLIKKAEELSILCGVEACAILDGPYDQTPVVWPSSETEIRRLLLKYEGTPQINHGQRKQNHEDFLKKCATKMEDKIERLRTKNADLEMENVMVDLLSGRPDVHVPFCDIKHLIWVINDKLGIFERNIWREEGANADEPTANMREEGANADEPTANIESQSVSESH